VNPGRAQCAIQGVAQKALEAYRTSFFIEVTLDGGLSPVFDLQFWFGRTLVYPRTIASYCKTMQYNRSNNGRQGASPRPYCSTLFSCHWGVRTVVKFLASTLL